MKVKLFSVGLAVVALMFAACNNDPVDVNDRPAPAATNVKYEVQPVTTSNVGATPATTQNVGVLTYELADSTSATVMIRKKGTENVMYMYDVASTLTDNTSWNNGGKGVETYVQPGTANATQTGWVAVTPTDFNKGWARLSEGRRLVVDANGNPTLDANGNLQYTPGFYSAALASGDGEWEIGVYTSWNNSTSNQDVASGIEWAEKTITFVK